MHSGASGKLQPVGLYDERSQVESEPPPWVRVPSGADRRWANLEPGSMAMVYHSRLHNQFFKAANEGLKNHDIPPPPPPRRSLQRGPAGALGNGRRGDPPVAAGTTPQRNASGTTTQRNASGSLTNQRDLPMNLSSWAHHLMSRKQSLKFR